MLLSIIIPTYRRFAPLLDTLDAVLLQRDAEFEIIVVDQNPEWPEELKNRKAALEKNPRIVWLHKEKPGVVAARHDAIEKARGDIFVFIDDDVQIPDPLFLARHASHYAADPTLDVVVGQEVFRSAGAPTRIGAERQNENESDETLALCANAGEVTRAPVPIPFAGSPVDQALRFDRQRPERYSAIAFCTCNSSCTRQAFFKVGGFDESFHGNAYGDDYDFAIRLGQAGGKFLYDPEAWLIHLQAPAGGLRMSDTKTKRSEKEKIYASMLFFVKYGQPPWRGYLGWRLLRRSVLLKDNLLKFWRQPLVWWGLWQAWQEARAANKRGAWSRFAPPGARAY